MTSLIALLCKWPLIRQMRERADGTGLEAMSDKTRAMHARIDGAEVARSICPYCGVGCGQLIFHKDGKLISIEGDPESPISQGNLCPKGAASYQLLTHDRRETKMKYRAPRAKEWTEIPLDRAMDMVADRIWESRKRTFVHKQNGATIIHGDPRFSRTSALADIWVPMRAGGDIAFLGGLVRHIIENNLFFRDYVVHFTNASCILREDFRDTDEGATGFFSGWNEEQRTYDKKTWAYNGDGGLSFPERDLTLQHPRCVLQTLRRHFARYTPEMVEKICGVSPALFHKVADALVAASGPDKSAAICYALGWTQHSKGVQIIRTAAILQLLLGNIGRPGGGILALRGHASIQGSTDIPTLYDTLPGYLPMPRGDGTETTLRDYLARHTRPTGLWNNFPAYFISLLKAYYGKNATAENDFGYNWLPKITTNHSYFEYLCDMADGKLEGMLLMGQNPAVAAANSRFERAALSKLKWLVVREMVEIEAATFWRDSPEIEHGELKTEEIETEVFLFPAAGHAGKGGAVPQTERLSQCGQKAVDPPGDARSEAWFMHQLALRLIAKAKQSNDPLDEPLRALDWWDPEDEMGGRKMEAVLAEINGWYTLEMWEGPQR